MKKEENEDSDWKVGLAGKFLNSKESPGSEVHNNDKQPAGSGD